LTTIYKIIWDFVFLHASAQSSKTADINEKKLYIDVDQQEPGKPKISE